MVRMSVPAIFSLVLGTFIIIFTYAMNPTSDFLYKAVLMLLVLVAVPLGLNVMNRRHVNYVADVKMDGVKLCKVKDLERIGSGTPVRIRGRVEKASFKWLNRPHFIVNDGSGAIRVLMFVAPVEDIKAGDSVETIGSLRPFGFSKEKKIWGLKMVKVSR